MAGQSAVPFFALKAVSRLIGQFTLLCGRGSPSAKVSTCREAQNEGKISASGVFRPGGGIGCA